MRAHTCHSKCLCEHSSYSRFCSGRKMCCRGDGSCGFVLVNTLMYSCQSLFGVFGLFFARKSHISHAMTTNVYWCQFISLLWGYEIICCGPEPLFSSFFSIKSTQSEIYWEICADKADTIHTLPHCCGDTLQCVDSTKPEPKEDLSFLSINKVSRVHLTSNFL